MHELAKAIDLLGEEVQISIPSHLRAKSDCVRFHFCGFINCCLKAFNLNLRVQSHNLWGIVFCIVLCKFSYMLRCVSSNPYIFPIRQTDNERLRNY